MPFAVAPITTPLAVRAVGRAAADAVRTEPSVSTPIAATASKYPEVNLWGWSPLFALSLFFIADSSISD
jgi:hypothetical protein